MDISSTGNISTDDFLAMVNTTLRDPLRAIHGLGINDTFANQTIIHGVYPSGYTLPHIVVASIIVTILMIIIVVGNMLVIIAIMTEKSLKNIQNWFIASLAVADFFLGLVIMPFSLANELMGYWIFGNWWCDVHSAMDVLLCTASIMNLCLISLDRYWSITQAIEYLKQRTPARAAFMIAAVWIMSALICIPPLLGWKAKRPEATEHLPQCQLSEDIGYVLYSALGSFYIPSCIMVFVYIRIYFAAKRRARRGIKKQPRKPPNEQVTSFTTNPNKGTHPMPTHPIPSASTEQQQLDPCIAATSPNAITATNNNAQSLHEQVATIEAPPRQIQIPVVTCDFASDMSTSEAADQNSGDGYKDTLKVGALCSMAQAQNIRNVSVTTTNGTTTTTTLSTNNELQVSSSSSPATGRNRALSVGVETDMVSEFDPSSSDSGVVSRCAVVKPLKFRLCQPIFGKKGNKARKENAKAHAAAHHHHHTSNKNNSSSNSSNQVAANNKANNNQISELEPALPKPEKKMRDPEKEKRRIARKKEKRATLILGLIMGSFIACWLPFFFLYILVPMCPKCEIPDAAFALAFWLGYMNSALNPAIYTIFNKDFRRAFRRILFK
ncbi:alpha-2C adrenergic receptor [Culicoides brevitarsis]|uniref:alpha-2C adrenergic receptor n=1 Tax=Culicoides brevitarsis TaxID=469753 RepID=UPI00307BCF30